MEGEEGNREGIEREREREREVVEFLNSSSHLLYK